MNSKYMQQHSLLVLIATFLIYFLTSCDTTALNKYTIGGTVSGLSGTLVLQNNGGDNRTVNASGSFTFSTSLAKGTAYSVTVSSQPAGQTCTVANGSGTIGAGNITNVQVTCTNRSYTVGGTVNGLNGTVVLQNNSGNDLTVNTSGAFTFSTALTHGTAYSVSVSSQPAGQTCTVTDGSGSVNAANVTDVQVNCSDNIFTIGGTVSGLLGGTLVLQNNSGDDRSVTANGAFAFNTTLADATAYNVTISSQPVGQTCTVTNGSGIVNAANVTNVQVQCVDSAAPSATILFPKGNSMTDGDTVMVYGTASDNGTISAIRVNGENAQTSDNYSTWEVQVPLATGLNTLTVETEDTASNTDSQADQTVIERKRYFVQPQAIVMDNPNNRFLMTDDRLDAIVAVDLTTGVRTILSDGSTPDASNSFYTPTDMVIDHSNNRVLVLNNSSIIAVDLTTGVRTVISTVDFSNFSNPFSNPRDMALDSANNRVLVTNANNNGVIATDLTTGVRTKFSDPSDPFITLDNPQGIVLDAANNRALVVNDGLNTGREVVAMDLTTGDLSWFSNYNLPDNNNYFDSPRDIVVDSTNNRALVTDIGLDAVIAVDLTTGARTILSDDSTPDANNPFGESLKIEVDSVNNRALISDYIWNTVIAVDLTTGTRTVPYDNSTPDYNNAFANLHSAVLDTANNRVLVTDSSLEAIIAVDLTTGARTIFSGDGIPDLNTLFGNPLNMALDFANNRALVIDSGLIAVDLTTGERTVFSDNTTPDTNNPFNNPTGIVVDAANNRALVTNNAYNIDAIIAVDLDTGIRTIFSDSSTPNANNPFSRPTGIAVDSVNNLAYVVSEVSDSIITVDLNTGERTILSSDGVPDSNNLFSYPRAIALDLSHNRALVTDDNLEAVVAVDLNTGERTIFSDGDNPNSNNPFFVPGNIVVDSVNNKFIVVDLALDALIKGYLESGDRVILSK